jgi:hypothetical protein
VFGSKCMITALMAKHHCKKNTIHAAGTDKRAGCVYCATGGTGMSVDLGLAKAGLVGADGSMSCEL